MDVSAGPVAAVIPAKDEADRIAATVAPCRRLPGVDLVVVVDDGSADATAELARRGRSRGRAAPPQPRQGGGDDHRRRACVPHERTPCRPRPAGRGTCSSSTPTSRRAPRASACSYLRSRPRTGRHDHRDPAAAADRRRRARLRRAPGPGRHRASSPAGAPTQPLSGMRCLTRAAFERGHAAGPRLGRRGRPDRRRAAGRPARRRGALRAAPPGHRSRTGAASCTAAGSTATSGWRWPCAG